jgi:hypothetical protein
VNTDPNRNAEEPKSVFESGDALVLNFSSRSEVLYADLIIALLAKYNN